MNAPRKHHYVPKFYLKGFTKSASVDGKLWVVDLDIRKSWRTTPAKAALEGDFYRGDLGHNVDPMWLERGLGEDVEPPMAQVLEFILDTKEIPPCGAAHDIFLNLVATSLVRGPSMRLMNSASFDEGIKRTLRELTSSKDGLAMLQKIVEGSDVSADELLEYSEQGAFEYDFDRITHLKALFDQLDLALGILSTRKWTARIVADDAPDLVCSDTPVGMIPLDKEVPLLRLDPNVLVVMPLNRRVAAVGSMNGVKHPDALGVMQVARINATIIRGVTQAYCSEPAFTVLNGQQVQRVELPDCSNCQPETRD